MSYNNGKITAPVTMTDIQRALGLYRYRDIGGLVKNGKINMWSKWKPVSVKNNADVELHALTGITEQDLAALNYGIEVGAVLQGSGFTVNEFNRVIADDSWTYKRPEGGVRDPYRMGDFRNYDHNAKCPFRILYNESEASEIRITLNNNEVAVRVLMDTTSPLSLNHWALFNSASTGWKYFVAFRKQHANPATMQMHVVETTAPLYSGSAIPADTLFMFDLPELSYGHYDVVTGVFATVPAKGNQYVVLHGSRRVIFFPDPGILIIYSLSQTRPIEYWGDEYEQASANLALVSKIRVNFTLENKDTASAHYAHLHLEPVLPSGSTNTWKDATRDIMIGGGQTTDVALTLEFHEDPFIKDTGIRVWYTIDSQTERHYMQLTNYAPADVEAPYALSALIQEYNIEPNLI